MGGGVFKGDDIYIFEKQRVMIFGRLELGTFGFVGFWLALTVSRCKLRGEENSTLPEKKKKKFIITKEKVKAKWTLARDGSYFVFKGKNIYKLHHL